MNLYSLPPIDNHIVNVPKEQQPSVRMLFGIMVLVVCGLAVSWIPVGQSTAQSQAQIQLARR